MSEYIFDVPDSNQPIAGDTGLYYPDERDEPMMVREEIVRCRDCRWLRQDMSDHEYRSGWWCDLGRFDPMPDDFCKWGERRVMEKA